MFASIYLSFPFLDASVLTGNDLARRLLRSHDRGSIRPVSFGPEGVAA